MNPEPQDAQSPRIYLNSVAATWPKPSEVLEGGPIAVPQEIEFVDKLQKNPERQDRATGA
jgi:hypothetical protein